MHCSNRIMEKRKRKKESRCSSFRCWKVAKRPFQTSSRSLRDWLLQCRCLPRPAAYPCSEIWKLWAMSAKTLLLKSAGKGVYHRCPLEMGPCLSECCSLLSRKCDNITCPYMSQSNIFVAEFLLLVQTWTVVLDCLKPKIQEGSNAKSIMFIEKNATVYSGTKIHSSRGA